MGVRIKNIVLKQIEDILGIYNELKSRFRPLSYLGMLGANKDEIAKTNGLIMRAKVVVSRYFGEDSIHFR
ncbi:hypothetical protein LCGC14_2404560 [marine sediment metagenome]|uniref:Uncharacterized protein n=1 Tax=marine sediment metagenome TaxID=412755 RepID=A0A0F9BUB8_9ZZZZ